MITWRIAWRNLWRNPRRTGLALAAISLSVLLVLVYNSILRGYGTWMLETLTGPMLGHVQVHAPTWRATRDMDRTLTHVSASIAAVRAVPGVSDVTARVYAPALAATGDTGYVVMVLGVDVDAERQTRRLLESRRDGLAPGHVLVGVHLAQQISAQIGSRIALVGQAVDGSVANDLFTIAGLIDTSIDMVNRQAVVMRLADAQALFALSDEAHELLVYTTPTTPPATVVARLRAEPAVQAQDIVDWRTAAPQLATLLDVVDIAWIFVLLLVFVAAAAGIANTMLMATFERTHEFGMLLALGTRPVRIVRLIAIEALLLGLVGAALGAAAGLAFVSATATHGIDYAALSGGGPQRIAFGGLNWSLRIYPMLTTIDFVRVAVAVMATSLAAAAWPAMLAARLRPAQALRN